VKQGERVQSLVSHESVTSQETLFFYCEATNRRVLVNFFTIFFCYMSIESIMAIYKQKWVYEALQ